MFLKHLRDSGYFVNVSFDNGECLVSISNGIKKRNNLTNKLNTGGVKFYINLQTLTGIRNTPTTRLYHKRDCLIYNF
ncbi:hypothetical protein [Helicobacter sp.]|uniref:hypothetical protein n=1 Tax=Helicobacter sp. TaxID=218 RepID=UPI0019C9D4B3|nr:hypothetical protein [Helicobacter sp.]MBD5165222.1 hypothetical protein [Helicobacter sp.]